MTVIQGGWDTVSVWIPRVQCSRMSRNHCNCEHRDPQSLKLITLADSWPWLPRVFTVVRVRKHSAHILKKSTLSYNDIFIIILSIYCLIKNENVWCSPCFARVYGSEDGMQDFTLARRALGHWAAPQLYATWRLVLQAWIQFFLP